MSSTVRTPGAMLASAALHAAVVLLLVWFTWQANRPKDVPLIFELVAGEGDNFAATEAPALGVPGIKLEIPEAPPSPVTPAVSPVSPVAPTPPVAPPVTAPPLPPIIEHKPVNLAKMVDRIADKRAANIEKKFRQEQAAAEARAAKEAAAKAKEAEAKAKEEEAKAKRMTKEEFDRLNKGKTTPAQKPAASTPIPTKRIDTAGIAGGVAGGSTANTTAGAGGKALTRQDIELSEAYISLLIQRLKEAHQKPDGLSDLLQTTVKFRLTSNGVVINVTIVNSSRNSEFDASVLAAFRRIKLPPPPANLRTNDYTITFKMKEDA